MKRALALATVVVAALVAACGSPDGAPGEPAAPTGDSVGSGGSGGSGPADTGSTSTTAGPAACDAYPDGPYGNVAGTYLPADLVLDGLLEGEDARTSVRLGDLRDCDGRTGVGALWLIGARATCSVCNAEAPQLDEDLPALRERGIRVVILMMDGRVEDWRAAHGLDGAVVLADLEETFYVDGANPFSVDPNGTPLNVIVDPRTGLIVDRDMGSYDRASLYALADRNRAP